MEGKDVVELIKLLCVEQIEVWLDGGWGVDALLGELTRPHDDVDIVITGKDSNKLRGILSKKGYEEIKKDDTRSWNFVLRDTAGREVDVHVVNFDGQKNGIYGPIENGQMYPAHAFSGTGMIEGEPVKCLTAQYQVESHRGYILRDKDFLDMTALCKKFNIQLSQEYSSVGQVE